jgi:DNA-binding MarR family transcriptional regulator
LALGEAAHACYDSAEDSMGTHTSNGLASEPTRRIMDSIRRVVHGLRVSSRQAEQRVGLSGAQLFVLQRLGLADSLSINELAERTSTHQSSVSVVVRRLVERKLVQRMINPRDKRRVELSLTPAGRKLARRSPNAAQDRLLQAVRQLPPSERRQLSELLIKVVSRMDLPQHPAQAVVGMFFEDASRRNKDVKKTESQELLS